MLVVEVIALVLKTIGRGDDDDRDDDNVSNDDCVDDDDGIVVVKMMMMMMKMMMMMIRIRINEDGNTDYASSGGYNDGFAFEDNMAMKCTIISFDCGDDCVFGLGALA